MYCCCRLYIGRYFSLARMRHLEPKDLFAAVVAAAEAPAERFFEEGRDGPDPLQDVHARPRDADARGCRR